MTTNGKTREAFQRRHYESIALWLRESQAPAKVIKKFADEFAAGNPRFDRDRFYKAVGAVRIQDA